MIDHPPAPSHRLAVCEGLLRASRDAHKRAERMIGEQIREIDQLRAERDQLRRAACTPAERAVLDACAAFPTEALRTDRGLPGRLAASVLEASERWCVAELARRGDGC